VLDACGLPIPDGLDGYSLLPEIDGRRPGAAGRAARRLRSVDTGDGSAPAALTEGNHYVMLRAGEHAAVMLRPLPREDRPVPHWPALYDLRKDPDLQRPLRLAAPWRERFFSVLRAVRARPRAAGEAAVESQVDEKTREQLKTLGYI